MNKLKNIKIKFCLIIIVVFFTAANKLIAQCTGCTHTITPGVASYTASAGNVYCLASGLTYTGSLVLNGGIICNSGIITNITFLSGTFENYGTYSGSNQTITPTATVTINNYSSSTFTMGNLSFPGSANRPLKFNVYKGAKAVFTSISTTSGVLNMEIGKKHPVSNPIPTATLNVNGLFKARNTDFILLVNINANAVMTNTFTLEGTGAKTFNNDGSVNIARDFLINNSSANVDNTNRIDVLGSLAVTGTGTINLKNSGSGSSLYVALSATLANATTTLTNNGTINITQNLNIQAGTALNYKNINISQDLNIQGGLATNSGTIINNNVIASAGTLTNNNYIKSNVDFLITNTVTTINNNGYINVIRDFNNQSTINLAKESLLQTKNYYNLGSTAIINGPASYIDTALYANILISDYSENTGYANGYIAVYDQSILSNTTNIGYGFDQITNPARIAATVIFGAKAVGPGTGNQPVIVCPILKKSFYSVQITAAPNPVCPGQPVLLTAQLVLTALTSGPLPFYIILPVTGPPTVSYSWIPAINFTNPNLQNQTVSPLITTNYGVNVTYNNCVYPANITVVVHPAVIANAGPDKPFVVFPGNFVQIGGTPSQTGGTAPFTYNWSPNLYFTNSSNNTQPNPYVNPPVNTTYILTVTDANGCVGTDQMDVYVLEAIYAILAKNIDGGIYDITTARNPNYAGKLNFKFDDEYVANGNNLDYKVYNMNRQLILTIPALSVAYKDNRYSINLAALAPFNSNPNSYYVLEVTDKKGEKTFLRFKY